MEQSTILTTPDLHFASYLKVKGCRIISVKREYSKRIFTFDVARSRMSIADLRFGYFNNDNDLKYLVDAVKYSDAIRSMKTLCHVDIVGPDITTPDLYFAAFLHTLRCNLKDVRRSPHKTIFVFDVTSSGLSATDIQLSYFNGDDQRYGVGALSYNDSIRVLKELCNND